MIVRAAIYWRGAVWSVPRPGRHNHVLELMRKERIPARIARAAMQGFLTDTGEFVGRCVARGHALDCGQLDPVLEPSSHFRPQLFTEDLW